MNSSHLHRVESSNSKKRKATIEPIHLSYNPIRPFTESQTFRIKSPEERDPNFTSKLNNMGEKRNLKARASNKMIAKVPNLPI